jgi:hypothetical protein
MNPAQVEAWRLYKHSHAEMLRYLRLITGAKDYGYPAVYLAPLRAWLHVCHVQASQALQMFRAAV